MRGEKSVLPKLQNSMTSILRDLKAYYGLHLSRLHDRLELPGDVMIILRRFFQLFDESCRLFLAIYDPSRKVMCMPGCHFCCYQTPYGVSILEYIYLYCGIGVSSPKRFYLPRLMDRCQHLWNAINNIEEVEDHDHVKASLEEYARRKIPCPFLDLVSGLCEVYDYRPLACRMHINFGPPRFCNPSHEEPWRCEAVNIEPSPVVKTALQELDNIFNFRLSQFLVVGITDFVVNVAKCRPIIWL